MIASSRATAKLLPGYCGLSAAARAGRIILVLTADPCWFFDDSGSEPTSRHFVLAGFLSTADNWAAFTERWRQALAAPPSIEYFKMSEAASLQPRGQFARARGWTEELRDERLKKLAHIIRQHVKVRISVSIRHDDFNKYVRTVPALGRRLASDHAYPFLFFRLMSLQLAMADHVGLLQRHDVVMDEQTGMEQEIRDLWPSFKSALAKNKRPQYVPLLGSQPYFLDDKQFLPLQAADLYAWQVRNYLMRYPAPLTRTMRMLRDVPSQHSVIDSQELANNHGLLLTMGEAIKRATPQLQFSAFPETKREQKKARRASAKARGAAPSRRKLPS